MDPVVIISIVSIISSTIIGIGELFVNLRKKKKRGLKKV